MKKSILAFTVLSLLTSSFMIKEVHAFTTYVVDSNLDDDHNGNCDPGICTLRDAINAANLNPNNAGEDVIHFNLSVGSTLISVQSALPFITDSVIIDGYSQPGAQKNTDPNSCSPTLVVELDGSNIPVGNSNESGFEIETSDTTITGLVINNFDKDGIRITTGRNSIHGNFIGTDVSGTQDKPNGFDGISIFTSSDNLIGGITPDLCNLISGNEDYGIRIYSQSSNNQILGNFIGTDSTGQLPLGNDNGGIGLYEANNTIIGGSAPGARNVISSNNNDGIYVSSSSLGTQIIGNYIGVDSSGSLGLGNSRMGILISNNAGEEQPAYTTVGPGNIISSNGDAGIYISSANHNDIIGNLIGTDKTGTLNLGNGFAGIEINSSDSNLVDGNVIAFNQSRGVETSGIDNVVVANSIFNNDPTLPGMHQWSSSMQPPVLTFVTASNGNLNLQGNLSDVPNSSFRLEFFSNTACNAVGYGDGETYLGSVDVMTNPSGDAAFNVIFPQVSPSQTYLTATATIYTDSTKTILKRTSLRFSDCQTLDSSSVDSVQFSVSADSVSENAGVAAVTITRSGSTQGPLTVDLDSSDGSAQSGLDYTAIHQTLTFQPSVTSQIVYVPILSDELIEGDETIQLTLTNLSGGVAVLGSPSTEVLTIVDVPPSASTPEPIAGDDPTNPPSALATTPATPTLSGSSAASCSLGTTTNPSQGILQILGMMAGLSVLGLRKFMCRRFSFPAKR